MEWHNPVLAEDVLTLGELRDVCNKALNEARTQQHIRSFLEASVVIETTSSDLHSKILQYFPSTSENLQYSLSDFLLVSQAVVSTDKPGVRDNSIVAISNDKIGKALSPVSVLVMVSRQHKCPRCWKHTSEEANSVCSRCETVLSDS